jgi:hypothetical protein
MKIYQEGASMDGPFPLETQAVREVVPDVEGVYLLASNRRDYISYVGRGSLKTRLRSHASAGRGDHFYFVEVFSDVEGFELECALFHRYGKATHLDNDIHPARPRGRTDLPRCSEPGCDGEPD